MLEVGLIIAALVSAQDGSEARTPQPQTATLESCDFIEERWVCRYRLPEIQLLGLSSPPPVTLPVPMAATAPATSTDPGVLTEAQADLVARCAAAGWLSLCLPAQRTEARRLRDEAAAYAETRQAVGRLISEDACPDAVARALSGGYLGLAREARGFCDTPGRYPQ